MAHASDDGTAVPHKSEFSIPKERVAGLFDGIVAITATLLILELKVPDPSGILTFEDLAETATSTLHWMVSFVMVAVIWTEFHVVFSHTKRWDGGLLVLTFLQMAVISLIPFASDLSGDFPDSFLATLVFAAVMGANGLMVSANIFFLQRKSHLHLHDTSHQHLHQRRRAQTLIYPASIVISVAAALLHDPLVGVLAWALCPVALAWHLRRASARAATNIPKGETIL